MITDEVALTTIAHPPQYVQLVRQYIHMYKLCIANLVLCKETWISPMLHVCSVLARSYEVCRAIHDF